MEHLKFSRLAALFFVPLYGAKFQPGSTQGCFWGKSTLFQVLSARLQMKRKLIAHFLVQLRPAEEVLSETSYPLQYVHVASGLARSTVLMAAATRFQLSVSCRKRFSPARVRL